MDPNHALRASLIAKMLKQMTKNLNPKRPNRSFPRNSSKSTQKYPYNRKSNC